MSPFLGALYAGQWSPMDIEIWMEPFAGGAGAGLTLLDQGLVGEVWLVEKNPALAAFWRAVVHEGAEFADRIEHLIPDMRSWGAATELLQAAESGAAFEDLHLGMAAFLVNRCSRSGIVNHRTGPIGGKRQNGEWSLTSRFPSAALAERVRHVHDLGRRGRIRIVEGDAIDHVAELNESGIGDEVFLFVDPPYIREGNRLYAHGMSLDDHWRLARALNGCHTPWMLTYDNEPIVSEQLYRDRRVLAYEIANTANRQRIAWEYAVFSDGVNVPESLQLVSSGACHWVNAPFGRLASMGAVG